MTKNEVFEITQKARKDNFIKAKSNAYARIDKFANEGKLSINMSLDIWFEDIYMSDIKLFVNELESNGFSTNFNDQYLEISWK